MRNAEFSWAAFIGGMAIALVTGLPANLAAGIGGFATGNNVAMVIIPMLPGALLALIARFVTKNGLSEGLLAGAIIVALVGGACGYSLIGERIAG